MSYLEIGFPILIEARDRLLRIQDNLAYYVSGKRAGKPWIVWDGPPMWIIMPKHYVSPPFGA